MIERCRWLDAESSAQNYRRAFQSAGSPRLMGRRGARVVRGSRCVAGRRRAGSQSFREWRHRQNGCRSNTSRLVAKSLDFLALLKSEGLRCDLRTLAPFSYWQTPAQFSMRFDTRFFIAALPEGQVPMATSYEVAHSLWLTPGARDENVCRQTVADDFSNLRGVADAGRFPNARKCLRGISAAIVIGRLTPLSF